MPVLKLPNPRPKIHPDALKELSQTVREAFGTDDEPLEDPDLMDKYAGKLINLLIKHGHRPLSTSFISVGFSDDPIRLSISIDHPYQDPPYEGRQTMLVLRLKEGSECSIALEMTRQQLKDLSAFIERAIATGLPDSLRFQDDPPPYLARPGMGKDPLPPEQTGGDDPLAGPVSIEFGEKSIPLLARLIEKAERLGISADTAMSQALYRWTQQQDAADRPAGSVNVCVRAPEPAPSTPHR